jgi:ribosomal protein L20A (L18A)
MFNNIDTIDLFEKTFGFNFVSLNYLNETTSNNFISLSSSNNYTPSLSNYYIKLASKIKVKKSYITIEKINTKTKNRFGQQNKENFLYMPSNPSIKNKV